MACSFSSESSRGWVSLKDAFWDECDVVNSDPANLTVKLGDGSTKTFARKQVCVCSYAYVMTRLVALSESACWQPSRATCHCEPVIAVRIPPRGYAGPAKLLVACRTIPGSAGWWPGAVQNCRFTLLSDVHVAYINSKLNRTLGCACWLSRSNSATGTRRRWRRRMTF